MVLLTMNGHNVIVAVSDGWLKLLGYARNEMVGHSISDFWAPSVVDIASRR